MGVKPPAGISAIGPASLGALFDDEVALAALNDGLNVGLLVSRCNQEPQRILAHPLERDGINLDRDSAGATSALTDERQQFTLLLNTLLKIRDVDVDLAEELLVADRPLFPR